MARVTYTDLERAAPYTEFYGYKFTTGQPTEVPDSEVEMLEICARHPYFKVEPSAPALNGSAEEKREEAHDEEAPIIEVEPEAEAGLVQPVEDVAAEQEEWIRKKGAEARRQNRDRRCPTRWHAWQAAWLEGYDNASGN